jgi:transcriptional regulator with XRE-family HTH domain
MSSISVAVRIKAQRERLRLTQSELAKAAGVSRSAATQWELGITHPSFEKTVLLSELLQCAPEWLAFGISPSVPEIGGGQIRLPSFDTCASGDSGAIHVLDRAFVEPWLREGSGEHLALAQVKTSQFDPVFKPNDTLLVALAGWRAAEDGYYFIATASVPQLVRVLFSPGEQAILTLAQNGGTPITHAVPSSKLHRVAIVRALAWRPIS